MFELSYVSVKTMKKITVNELIRNLDQHRAHVDELPTPLPSEYNTEDKEFNRIADERTDQPREKIDFDNL